MNALFSENKLKVGLFGTNGAAALSTVPEVWRPKWPAIVEATVLADQAGFEAQLGYARWKGFVDGRPGHGPDTVMDSFTWAAGLSQVTKYTTLIATVHPQAMHPVTVAKQGATIDQMSNGRFALNIVAGANRGEIELFGEPMKDHGPRYDHLQEWLEILTRLWTEDMEFDHDGENYQVLSAVSQPKPVQKPYPPVINAGISGRGREFATSFADVGFLMPPSEDPAVVREYLTSYKAEAEGKGRSIQAWTYCPMVQRDSRAEAEEYYEYFAETMADEEVRDAQIASAIAGTQVDPEWINGLKKIFAAGGGHRPLVGTARDIADQLEELSDAGMDGVLFIYPDFIDGVKRFTAEDGVMDELERRGLRKPFHGV